MHEFSLRRVLVFLRWTSPVDRIALAILVLYSAFEASALFGRRLPFSSLLGFLSFLALFYFLIRLLPWVRTRLLWRLRYRLVAAYIFIAVVPLVLLLTMAGVASYLLYLELGAHLLNDDLQDRISVISADADAIASAIQRESAAGADATNESVLARPGVASLIAADRAQWPQLRVLLNHGQQMVKRGNGRHFAGLVEHEGILCFASAESRPDGQSDGQGSVSLVVIAPLTSDVLDGLQSELGPVQMMLLRPVSETPSTGFSYSSPQGQIYAPGQEVTSRRRRLQPPANRLDFRVAGASILDAAHLDEGAETSPAPIFASFSLRPSALNRRLFSSVGELGPKFVLALLIVGAIFLVLEFAALATGIVLTRTITSAVADLHEATLRVRRGDFTHRIRVHQRDQLGDLAESFNEMSSSVSELIEEQRRRQRLENEISIAREVQEQLFPRSIPALPGLQLAALCRPARVVSGDYYDFIRLGPTRIAIALADISGKGIFAALLMASLQAALRSTAALDGKDGTASLVSRLNTHVFNNTSDDRYATFFYAVYDTESKMLTYTNAGHLAPFFVSDTGVQSLDEGGTVVGLFEDCRYTQGTLRVEPGSLLVAFSDGLTEPENVYGEEFGMLRLKEEILRQRTLPAQRLAENLIAAAEQWAGTAEQADDITVVIARMS
jgi:sigma-B regulation protein RsbU (phosphoserine phosphatase)